MILGSGGTVMYAWPWLPWLSIAHGHEYMPMPLDWKNHATRRSYVCRSDQHVQSLKGNLHAPLLDHRCRCVCVACCYCRLQQSPAGSDRISDTAGGLRADLG